VGWGRLFGAGMLGGWCQGVVVSFGGNEEKGKEGLKMCWSFMPFLLG